MPKIVSAETVPVTIRVVGDSKWRELVEAVVSVLADAKRRETEAVAEELSQEDWGKALQACRTAAKRIGRRVAAVYRDGTLYVKDGGEFRPMSPEQAAERDRKRKETMAKKAAEAKAAGKPSPAKEAASGRSRRAS